MRPEAAFYQLLRPHLPGHPERIENAAGAGTPDFHCIYNGTTYWVECKAPKAKTWNLFDLLEPSQRAWRVRYLAHGGNLFYAVRSGSSISLFDGNLTLLEKFEKPFDWSAFQLKIILQLLVD